MTVVSVGSPADMPVVKVAVRRPAALVVAAATAVMASVGGCSSNPATPGQPQTPVAASTPAPGEASGGTLAERDGPVTLTPGWTTTLRAVDIPYPAPGGIVFHSLTPEGTFEVVSLDPESGAVQWSAPASPSTVPPGVDIGVVVLNDRRVVAWLEPNGPLETGAVSLVAADPETGRRLWSYGDGGLRLTSYPHACRGWAAICLNYGSGQGTTFVVLDGSTGEVLESDTAQTDRDSLRKLASGLYEDGSNLVAVDDADQVRWERPFSDVYGGADVDPDYGWEIQLRDGVYAGTIGVVEPQSDAGRLLPGRTTVELAGFSALAGFAASDGQTLWARPDASTFCGALDFDADHPVRCVATGLVVNDRVNPAQVINLDVTLEGFDLATGETTWAWHAGAVRGLVIPPSSDGAGRDILRLDETRYLVDVGDAVMTVDLDRGEGPGAATDVGWCENDTEVEVAFRVAGFQTSGYSSDRWYPCTIDGVEADIPGTVPDFGGAEENGYYVWTDAAGTVRGARIG